jgi:hypothetical protein
MDCPTDVEILSSLDGAPAPRGTEPIEAHLEACALCAARARAIEAIDAALATGVLARDRDARRLPPRLRSRLVAIGTAATRARAISAAPPRVNRISALLRSVWAPKNRIRHLDR